MRQGNGQFHDEYLAVKRLGCQETRGPVLPIGSHPHAAMLLQRYMVRLPVGGAVGAPRFQVTLRPEGASALWLQRRDAPQEQ